MEAFVVQVDVPKLTLKQKLAMVPLFGGIYSILMFCAKWFWPTSSERQHSLTATAVEAGLMGLFFGIFVAFVPRASSSNKLLVDEDSITGVKTLFGSIKWPVWRTTVRKNKLRTIFYLKSPKGTNRGIGLSERGKFGARMLGFVAVPNTLPEYEAIRQLAERWLPAAKAD